jgi:hypothetical protein
MKATTSVIFAAVFGLAVFAVQSSSANSARQAPSQQKVPIDKPTTTPDDIQQEHIGLGIGRGEGQGRGQGSGQGHGCQMPTVEDHLAFLDEKLSFSQEQQAMAGALLKKHLDLLDNVRKDKSLSHDDRISKTRNIRQASASMLRDLLNEDQKAKFDEMLRDKTEIMNQRREKGEDCALIWIAVE